MSELNLSAQRLLEGHFPDVWVEGEVSRPTRAASGHLYFTLKDAKARVDAVLWATRVREMRFRMEEGQQVRVRGRLTIYGPSGRYQLICQLVRPAGEGALRAALEKLKQRLEGEGLFDPGRKRPLPFLPRGVGLLTSPTGAAVQDICRLIFQRFPSMRVVLCPVAVQGAGSAEEIARGIARLNQVAGLDVIVVGRGGGSLEDLWSFNEEIVVRALAASRLPVVSAVGHEIDITLADLVADARAPTPTGAGELVVPEFSALVQELQDFRQRLGRGLGRSLKQTREQLQGLWRSSTERVVPRILNERRQAMDLLEERALRAVLEKLSRLERGLEKAGAALWAGSPLARTRERRTAILGLRARLLPALRGALVRSRAALQPEAGKLQALNPLAVLRRGFTVTQVEREGRRWLLRSGGEARPGERLVTSWAEGDELHARVEGLAPRKLPEAAP